MRLSYVFYIYSPTKYLMNTYYVSGSDLVAKNTEWNQRANNPYSYRIYVLVSWENNKNENLVKYTVYNDNYQKESNIEGVSEV